MSSRIPIGQVATMTVLVVGLAFGLWQVKQNQNIKKSSASGETVCPSGLDCNLPGDRAPGGSFACVSPVNGQTFNCCPSGLHRDNMDPTTNNCVANGEGSGTITPPPPTCGVTILPNPVNLRVGESKLILAGVDDLGNSNTFDKIISTGSDINVITVAPAKSYNTSKVVGVGAGVATVTTKVYRGDTVVCSGFVFARVKL